MAVIANARTAECCDWHRVEQALIPHSLQFGGGSIYVDGLESQVIGTNTVLPEQMNLK